MTARPLARAALLLLAACGAAPAAPTPAGPPAHGRTALVRVAGWALAVAAEARPGPRLGWSAAGLASAAAGTWLVLACDRTNTGGAPEAVYSPDVRLVAAGGRASRTAADTGADASSACRGGRTLGTAVPPAATARSSPAFDVPAAATGLQLVFGKCQNSDNIVRRVRIRPTQAMDRA